MPGSGTCRRSSPVAPDFARRSVAVANTTAAGVKPGEPVTLAVSKLDLTSLGSPVNTSLTAVFTDAAGKVTRLGTVPVAAGTAAVSLPVPAGAAAGAATLVLTAAESGTTVTADVTVAAVTPPAPVCKAPTAPTKWYDVLGWIRYGIQWLQYQVCLRG